MLSFVGNNARRKGDYNMKKTTDFIFAVVLILAATLVSAIMPTEKDAAIYEDTLRLHILANSDSDEDQKLKIEIRDKLLAKYGMELKGADTRESAEEKMAGIIPEIKRDVDKWISDAGYSYTSTVSLGLEWYDTREYDSFTLPKGYYTSLQVMLGEAEGKNWWCVMYPPLCLDIATEDAPSDDAVIGYTKEEYSLITEDGYNVKFKLLEVFSEAFSKNG